MRIVPTAYVAGGSWGICQRCGFKFRLNELRLDAADWDPLPDTMRPPRNGPEGRARPDASPEPPDTFISAPVTPEDL